ncbi:MAG: relaxase/mobilization nuclease domain-containing protein [Cyanobacteria bacterium P01_A01_bin.37]
MIGNLSKTNRGGKLVQYVLGKDGASLIGTNMGDRTIKGLSSCLCLGRRLNRNIKQPFVHISLSLPPGKDLEDDTFNALAQDYLEGMGYSLSRNLYLVGRHTDRGHSHIHIVVSRIDMQTRKCVSDSFERYRSQEVIRQLEETYSLDKEESSWAIPERTLEPELEDLPALIKASVADSVSSSSTPSLTKLAENLASKNVLLDLHLADSEEEEENKQRIKGISYRYKNRTIPGSALGANYIYKGLHRQGLQYQSHDAEFFKTRTTQAKHLSDSYPFIRHTWAIMKRLNTSSIQGTNYVLLRGRIKANPNGEVFQIRRNKDGQPIVTLEAQDKNDASTITFKLSDCKLTQDDTRTFTDASKKVLQLRRSLSKNLSQNRKSAVTELLQM